MVFSEENFELEKQMGCMAGIFHIFDRQHLLTGRSFGRHGQKRLPSGNHASSNKLVKNKSSHQAILEKTLTENSGLSTESSRASCSSSSCSSFSSVNETFLPEKPLKETLNSKKALDLTVNETCFTEKPLKETLNPKKNLGLSVNETFCMEKPLKETLNRKNALDLRDIVKESINREALRGLTVKTEKITKKDEIEIVKKMGLNRKDSPRPVLLSKSMDGTYVIGIDRSINNNNYNNINEYKYNNSNNNINNYYYSRYSCDGRDLGPQNCTNNNYNNNNNNNNVRLVKDLPRLSLDSRKESLKKSNFDQNYDSPGQHRRSNSLIARLMGLELLPDLGGEIGEKFEIKTRRDSCLANNLRENEIQIQHSKFENEIQNSNFENLVVKTKRTGEESAPWRQQEKNVGTKLESEIQKKLREFQKKGENFDKRGEKTRKSFESPIVIMKPAKNKSREFEEKKKSFKQGSKVKQVNKESASNSNSPRTPPRILQKNRDSDRKSTNRNSVNSFSDLGSPKSKINRPTSPKMKTNFGQKLDETEITTPRRKSNYKVIKENASEKEMAVVSPVSVLDISFYQDELTPQKRLSESFKDGETCTSEESWNARSPPSDQIKSENIETLIQKLAQLSLVNHEPPSGDSTAQQTLKSKDHEYIHEVLFASGLLINDLSFIAQRSEYPINPDLFLVLEQTKIGDKNNRKLIFNLLNEILVRKLESKGPFCSKKIGGERLFEDLCKEIDEIQKNSKRVEFECGEFEEQDDGFEIPDFEMIQEMKGWEKFETEMQMMVSEIEKSIFRDLIDEVVETNNNNQRRIRRQLF